MENKELFTIQEVAEKIGRSAYTIGRWQKEGYVTPIYSRDENGRLVRFFTEEDIEILEGVKEKKLEIMLSGVGEGGADQ